MTTCPLQLVYLTLYYPCSLLHNPSLHTLFTLACIFIPYPVMILTLKL